MQLQEGVSLAHKTTMQLGGDARYLAEVTSEDELVESVAYAKANNVKIIVIGSGSNIIFGDGGFNGLVIVNKIKGYHMEQDTQLLTANSGEIWDDIVAESVKLNLAGIEALSLIPGTVGGAPVNNIGAYGQEIKDTIVRVRAYDTQNSSFVVLDNATCQFSYRNSIFKDSMYGRYIITQVIFKLHLASNYTAPTYASLSAELTAKNITTPTVQDVRTAVVTIRTAKLPDPSLIPNTGSFFKNPIISKEMFANIQKKYPDIPHYQVQDGIKLAAGWLIETAGLKGYSQDGIKVYEKQALVLINEGTRSYQSLLNMKNYIQAKVYETCGVTLEPEPEIIA